MSIAYLLPLILSASAAASPDAPMSPSATAPILAASAATTAVQPVQGAYVPGMDAAPQIEIIPIAFDANYRMTVDVSIDGAGPYSFMIDTGSERTVVSRRIAGELELEFAEAATLMGVAGNMVVDTAYVPEVTLGLQNYGELVAPILEPRHIGADGILGLDGLQDQRILFDFAANEIHVENLAEPLSYDGFDIVVRARRRSGQLIFTDATIAGIDVNVVIDTGAQTSIGNRALQRRLAGRRAQGRDVEGGLLSVTGQSIMADMAIVPDFQIGRVRFNQIGIAFADAPPFEALGLNNRPTLFLGMSALRKFDRVVIDFAERQVLFDLPRNAPRYSPRPGSRRNF